MKNTIINHRNKRGNPRKANRMPNTTWFIAVPKANIFWEIYKFTGSEEQVIDITKKMFEMEGLIDDTFKFKVIFDEEHGDFTLSGYIEWSKVPREYATSEYREISSYDAFMS